MERIKKNLELKPLFLERIKLLLPDENDLEGYLKILKVEPVRSIRCNKLKISPEKLKENLEKKGWKISQPFKEYPEVMIVENNLSPGELGRSLEHLLGYYYVQELASMLPIICLAPGDKETILDLCASPGSKTTQIAAELENRGLIIANEPQMDRLRILASNLERCGVTNTIITRKDGRSICKDLKEANIEFDKILVDAPCSGEGTLRSSPKTYLMWNIKTIQNLPKIQERLFSEAFETLKVGGELVYSTCTHAPEENEGVVNDMLEKFGERIKIEKVNIPLKKVRPGLTEWQGKKYSKEVKNCARIYPHDNNTEGFFISKFRRVK
ncbi:tRNA (cytosine(49)-C(5))-methyltransferase [uncultured archaeon]|nr:tRNA (cytosine(49)-C(5))-methyltransferase [uncultured archaeon]